MALAFPNPSRSFDEVRRAVCFTGHDGMHQVRFFIDVAALAKAGIAQAGSAPEARYLSAFDTLRASIHDVAGKAYARSQRDSYTLTSADFR